MDDILNVYQVKEILDREPGAKFSLQPIRVPFIQGKGYIVAGYHIFRGYQMKMRHVIGDEIWDYVKEPELE